MKRAMVPLAVAGLVLSALGLHLSSSTLSSSNSVSPRITQAVDENQRVVLKGNTHPLARPQFDHGAAPADLPLNRMLLVLRRSPEQESALRQLLDEQQDKSSPNYHKWLTPDEFGKKFGPADQDIQVTTSWLQQHGFQIGKVARGRTVIEFSGTAAQVQETFGTSIHKYVVKGKEHWANTSDPQIPAALAPIVGGLASLNNFPRKSFSKVLGGVRRSKETGSTQPLFTFTPPGVQTLYAIGPSDFATIYNLQPLWNAGIDGTGQTVAVVGVSDINVNDVAQFRNLFGLPFNNPTVIYNGPNPGINGAETEGLLDVQWAGAVARGATIDYVVSEDTETTAGIDLSAIYIVDNDLAPVMSESFGLCEAFLGNGGNNFVNLLWSQAAAEGITVSISSGDGGSAGCDDFNSETQARFGLEVSGYASTPYNVAVGGTDFDQLNHWATYWNSSNTAITNSSAKSYIHETTWNDSCGGFGLNGCTASVNRLFFNLIAGSGGPSNCSNSIFTGGFIECQSGTSKPSWQSGTGVPADYVRDTPDISLFASNGFTGSFYVICESDAVPFGSCDLNSPYADFLGVGGTSASAPAFAGIMALVNQKVNSRQGQANYILYPLAVQAGNTCNSSTAPLSGSSCIFYDITKGNNSVPCMAGSLNCGTGPAGGSGILVNPNAVSSPAWMTSSGYDFATGLGSVNIANLVNGWKSSFIGSTTTLLLNGSTNPVSITHGQSVNVSIGVSPSLNGNVALVGQPIASIQGIAGFALNGGTASGTISTIPGGPTPSHTYSIWAHFPGNGTYGASDSAPISVTVNPENSFTFLHLVTIDPNTGQVTNNNATTVGYGSPYLLRVDIENAAQQTCVNPPSLASGCPSGTVQLTDNSNPLGGGTGAFTLNSLGYLEDQLVFSELGVGAHSLQASYGGDNSYQSSSASGIFTVTPDPTAISVSAQPAFQGATFSTVISTTSALQGPTGNVSFVIDGQNAGSVLVGGSAGSGGFQTGVTFAQGTAAFPDSGIANGTHLLQVNYTGDNNYGASSAQLSFLLQPDFTISSLSPSQITIPSPGGAGTLSFSLGALDGFTGTVNFSCSGLPAESACNFTPATIKGAGSTLLTVTTTPAKSSEMRYGHHVQFWAGAGGVGIAGVFLLGVPTGTRRGRKMIGFVAFVILLVSLGCGGGSGSSAIVQHDPGTTAGTYNVTINAASGSLVHHAGFQLVIQ